MNVLTHCNADGSRLLMMVPLLLQFMPLTTADCQFTCGLPKPDREIRVPNLQPGSWASTVCRMIIDSAAGHLMQRGAVDLVIVGTLLHQSFTGDVANKIGTYLKVLAAKDNNVPFYVALPSSSFDWKLRERA